jgi:hypothetical protein
MVDSAQSFGRPMAGFEIDFRKGHSRPVVLIARVEPPELNNVNVMRSAEMTYYERTSQYGFPNGSGVKILAGGSVNDVQGIDASDNRATELPVTIDPVVRAITLHNFDRLVCEVGTPRVAYPWAGSLQMRRAHS